MMRVAIKLQFESPELASQILESVNPENLILPPGLSISSMIDEATISFAIETTRGIQSLMATVEDILSSIDLSMRTRDAVEAPS